MMKTTPAFYAEAPHKEEHHQNKPLTLSQTQWSHFFEDAWDKIPVVIKRPFGENFPKAEELFLALVALSDASRQSDATSRIRFTLEHEDRKAGEERRYFSSMLFTPEELLPERADGSIAG